VRNLETHFRMKNGESRTMLWSADVIEYGGEACLIAIARDVSPQRALEKELLESQIQLSIKHKELINVFMQMETIRREWEQTLDCISDMFILADQDDRIRRFNRALEMFTGLAHRDIVGRIWQEFLAEHGLAANVATPGKELCHGRTGRRYVLNHYAFTDSDGNGLARNVVIIHDATTENQLSPCSPECEAAC
jgi:PAS domain S-box-containing protein